MDLFEDPVPAKTGAGQDGEQVEPTRNNRGQFIKGFSGNPRGMPPGIKHKYGPLVEVMTEQEAPELIRKALDLAKAGDPGMLRWAIDRLWPPRKGRAVYLGTIAGCTASEAYDRILEAVCNGELTPFEAELLSKVVESRSKSVDQSRIEERLAALEERLSRVSWAPLARAS